MRKIEEYAMTGAMIALGLAVLYTATRGVKGAAADLVGGVVGGTIDAVTGAVVGAYNAVPEAIKPSSDQNIIYQGVNKVVTVLPGATKDSTLGTWIYDITH